MNNRLVIDPVRTTKTLDGCELSYLRAGAGSPILFLHGEDGNSGWEPWMSDLAVHHDVIVPDHPAFGFSEWPAWLDDVHDLAYFYLDFLEEAGLREVHLVGHSLGGWIAAEMAVRDRTRLSTLALVASGGIRLNGVPKFDRFIVPPEEVTRAGYFDTAIAERQLQQPAGSDDLDRDLRNRFAVARLQWQPRHNLRLPKWLHRLRLPTLIVWGEDDRIVPCAYAEEFARLIPAARVVTLPRCGHFPQVEKPEAFVRAISSFAREPAL